MLYEWTIYELLRKCDTEVAMLLFSYNSELFLTPTHPPVQKGSGAPSRRKSGRGMAMTTPHPPPFSKEVKKKSGALPPYPPLSFLNIL